MNEFYISSIRHDAPTIEIKGSFSIVIEEDMSGAMEVPEPTIRVPGRQSISLEITSAGSFDKEALMDAFKSGKRIKIAIND